MKYGIQYCIGINKMKIVDFIGSPCVGKTTLYNELLSGKSRKNLWVTPKEAKIRFAKSEISSKIYQKLFLKDIYKAFLLYSNIYKISTPDLPDIILQNSKHEVLNTHVTDVEKLVSAVIKSISQDEINVLRKLYGIKVFNSYLLDFLFLKSNESNNLVIFEESLSHRVLSIVEYHKKFDEFVKSYGNYMPKPDLLVHLYASEETIFKRMVFRINKTRKTNLLLGYKNWDNDLLRKMIRSKIRQSAILVDILEKRGVTVLKLDMEEDIKKNANQIIENIISL